MRCTAAFDNFRRVRGRVWVLTTGLRLLDINFRILQWNVERGYKLPGIIEELKQIDADVICLQAWGFGLTRKIFSQSDSARESLRFVSFISRHAGAVGLLCGIFPVALLTLFVGPGRHFHR